MGEGTKRSGVRANIRGGTLTTVRNTPAARPSICNRQPRCGRGAQCRRVRSGPQRHSPNFEIGELEKKAEKKRLLIIGAKEGDNGGATCRVP